MFTPLQFSQLAAAAWQGPAAAQFATIAHYVSAAGTYTTTRYSVSYHPHECGGPCYQAQEACPFIAVQAAISAAARAGVLSLSQVAAGTAVLLAAEQQFSGQSQDICHFCGASITPEGYCECDPATLTINGQPAAARA